MTGPCQFPGCGMGEFYWAHSCWGNPHSPKLDCHPYAAPPTPPQKVPVTAPCQYPGCGEGEFDRAHTCIVDIPHSAYLGCHPYNPLPPEPTSALGYLLGHLDVV